jgi:glutathione reductase (NADPH)
LPAKDADAVAKLEEESERIGIKVRTGVSLRRIEPVGSRFRVIFAHDGIEQAAEADRVVNGAGRIANVESLDLASGQVEHANGRIIIDQHLRSTSNPQVHVCGDVVPVSPQLSPIATYEGDIVGRNIVEGPTHVPDYAGLATSVYTVPALAAVGLTETAARQKGVAIDVHVNDMRDWFSARSYAETVAWSKVIVDRATDRILGAHFVGHAGQELVNIFGLAMKFGITAGQLRETVYAYPTFSADIKHMLGHA